MLEYSNFVCSSVIKSAADSYCVIYLFIIIIIIMWWLVLSLLFRSGSLFNCQIFEITNPEKSNRSFVMIWNRTEFSKLSRP